MTEKTSFRPSQLVLRVNGIFLMFAGGIAAIIDLLSYFLGAGPWGDFLYQRSIAVGPFEAHYLALVLGFLITKYSKYTNQHDLKFWIKVALAIELNLGISNIIWFQIFYDTNTLVMGYIATSVHIAFIILHISSLSIMKAKLKRNHEVAEDNSG